MMRVNKEDKSVSTALIIVNDFANKKKLSQYLQKNRHLALEFPRTVNQSLDLAQNINPSLIVILLDNAYESAVKLCRFFKRSPATSHIPVLLIQPPSVISKKQIADAHLNHNFTERDFDQVIRQFTMGY